MVINKELVRQLMEERDISQTQLAEMAGVSKGTISRWLGGTRGEGPTLIGGIIRSFPDVDLGKIIITNSI